MNRETWLNDLAALMAPRFEEMGFPLPKFRVAIGWTGSGANMRVAGECWHASASADNAFEILISPVVDDSIRIAATLAHELIHAAVGFEHKHGGAFRKAALALGLQAPMTATTAGPDFIEWTAPFLQQLGDVPHARVSINTRMALPPTKPRGKQVDATETDSPPLSRPTSTAKPKQSTRMLKAICQSETDGEACGYTVRITRKWVDELGAPCCPVHGSMTIQEGSDL